VRSLRDHTREQIRTKIREKLPALQARARRSNDFLLGVVERRAIG